MDFSNYLNNISIDCVIFGFHDNELKVLLLKIKNLEKWALPGGFISTDKDMDSEAVTILNKRTGIDNIFLQQFHVFGNLDRNDSTHVEELINKKVIEPKLKNWFSKRFVSVGYYALVEYFKVKKPTIDQISEACEWITISDLPPLILDHGLIIKKAHETLQRDLLYQPIGLNLLSNEFTMRELQSLYETILQRKVDRRNFRRKILSYGILLDTGKRKTGLNHKPPILYAFDERKYIQALETGLSGMGF